MTAIEINTQPLSQFHAKHNTDMDRGTPCVVNTTWPRNNIPTAYTVTENGRGSCVLMGQYYYSRKLAAWVYRPNDLAGRLPQPSTEWLTEHAPIASWPYNARAHWKAYVAECQNNGQNPYEYREAFNEQ